MSTEPNLSARSHDGLTAHEYAELAYDPFYRKIRPPVSRAAAKRTTGAVDVQQRGQAKEYPQEPANLIDAGDPS